jgi:hypothetical protein
MRFVRLLLTAAALLGATACAEAVANAAGVWVSVSPATVNAGAQTRIQASCGENVNSATVSSVVFGSETLQPVAGVLTTTVTVPANTHEGTYGVRLACPTGSQAMTTLTVLGAGKSSAGAIPGPGTGGGFLASNEAPVDWSPVVWLGVGLSLLVTSAVVAVRTNAVVLARPARRRAHRRKAGPR